MQFSNKPLVRIGLVIVLAYFFSACRFTPPLATPSATGISVGITDDTCPSIEIQLGQQVTWTNQGIHEHIVRHKLMEGNSQFDSGKLQSGDSYVFTYLQSGSYYYDCSEDGSMTGIITVLP